MRRSTLAVVPLGLLLAVACSEDVSRAEPATATEAPATKATSPEATVASLATGGPAATASTGTTGPPASAAAPARFTVTPGPPVGQLQTEPDPGEVKLWLSNQSFTDDPVAVSVVIDGEPALDAELEVQGQHNWIPWEIGGLNPGVHTITARSDTGAELTGTFTLPAGEPRWVVLDYWYASGDAEGRRFVLNEFDHAVAFD